MAKRKRKRTSGAPALANVIRRRRRPAIAMVRITGASCDSCGNKWKFADFDTPPKITTNQRVRLGMFVEGQSIVIPEPILDAADRAGTNTCGRCGGAIILDRQPYGGNAEQIRPGGLVEAKRDQLVDSRGRPLFDKRSDNIRAE